MLAHPQSEVCSWWYNMILTYSQRQWLWAFEALLFLGADFYSLKIQTVPAEHCQFPCNADWQGIDAGWNYWLSQVSATSSEGEDCFLSQNLFYTICVFCILEILCLVFNYDMLCQLKCSNKVCWSVGIWVLWRGMINPWCWLDSADPQHEPARRCWCCSFNCFRSSCRGTDFLLSRVQLGSCQHAASELWTTGPGSGARPVKIVSILLKKRFCLQGADCVWSGCRYT